MVFAYCPQHSDEQVDGTWANDEDGWGFTCDRSGHVFPGSYTWTKQPEPPAGIALSGVAEELGLAVELPASLKSYPGTWVEYGVLEAAYAASRPADWEQLVTTYGHRALGPSTYTASKFLARTLSNLARQGAVVLRMGPATGLWTSNSTISWWSLPPEPEWDRRLSFDDSKLTFEYVPGQTAP